MAPQKSPENILVSMPDAGSQCTVDMGAGQQKTLGFGIDSVQTMQVLSGGALEIKLDNGGTLVINNYESAARQGGALRYADGRTVDFSADAPAAPKTAAQILAETASQASIEAGSALDKATLTDPSPAAGEPLHVVKPAAEQLREYIIAPGQKYVLDLGGVSPVAVKEEGGDLVLLFEDKSTLVLKDFAAAHGGKLPPAMTLADGTVISLDALLQGKIAALEPAAGEEHAPAPEKTKPAAVPAQKDEGVSADQMNEAQLRKVAQEDALAKKAAALEPAAGETAESMDAAAQRLAGIQPAAGPGAGSTPAGARTNSGYGFNSSPDAVNLTPIAPVGPIDPTALQYGVEFPTPEIRFLPEGEDTNPLPPLTPVLVAGNAMVKEDGSVFLPISVTPTLSNSSVTVTVEGIGPGWTVSGPGVYNPATGTWTVTVSGPYNGGLTLSPPPNSDVDLNGLVISVTEENSGTEQSGSTETVVDVIVDAVADKPDLSTENAKGLEDHDLPLVIQTAVNDPDGSETITAIYIRNVPEGFILSAGINQGGGVWKLSQSELAGLTVTPPANYSGSVTLQIESVARETHLSGGEFDMTDNTASTFDEATLTWCPVPDAPVLSVCDACVKEDGSVFIPVEAALTDRDGSEFLTLKVSGVPAGWTFSGASWVSTGVAGEYKVVVAAGADYTGGFTLKPPANSDVDLPDLKITALSTETANGESAQTIKLIDVTVDAVADKPTIVAEDRSGNQGTALDVKITAAVTDTDGSETITKYEVSGVPAGFSFNQGTNAGGGVWSFTPAQIAGLKITPPAGYAGTLSLKAKVYNGETALSGAECDAADNKNSNTDGFCLTWKNVFTPPTITVNNGCDDVCVKEDGSVFVKVVAGLGSGDGDEVLTVKVSGIKPGWTILNTDGTYNAATGVWSVTLPAGQGYNGGLTFKPPANSDVDLSGLTGTASAYDPDSATTLTATDGFRIIVDAVADKPCLSVPDCLTWAPLMGTAPMALNIAAAVTDTDGSESITKVRIELPANAVAIGAALNQGTNLGNGIWDLTPSQLSGLKLVWTLPNPVVTALSVNTVKVTAYNAETTLSGAECDLSDNTSSVTKCFDFIIARSPLVVDIDRDGTELVSLNNGVLFDMTLDGKADQTGWVGKDDGLLVFDRNADGLINNASELFGTATTDGFTILAGYDSNSDGKIDSVDTVFSDLLVWQDANQDGVSQGSELITLGTLGIASINLAAEQTLLFREDNVITHISDVTYGDGSTGEIVDAWFGVTDSADIGVGVALNGTEGADTLHGSVKNDVLYGGDGNDVLYGGKGTDVFLFKAGDSGVDTIADFDLSQGDSLDLSDLLSNFDPLQDAIDRFVHLTEENGNTVVTVDAAGAGDFAHGTTVAVIGGVTGLDLDAAFRVHAQAVV